MKKKLFIGIGVFIVVLILAFSGNICSMQSVMEDKFVTETYTETFDFKEHTLTAAFVRHDHTDETTVEMEYIYDYAEDTVTLKI